MVKSIRVTRVTPSLMWNVLPQSRALNGLIVTIEGLAVWVVAIFLSSLETTGWFIWPGTDMYTTAVGTMRNWIASGGVTPFEIVGYLGLTVAIAGPLWFWVAAPAISRLGGWSSSGARSNGSSRGGGVEGEWEADWISATELAEEAESNDSESEPAWPAMEFEPARREPESIQAALANGDFFRGSGAEGDDRKAGDSSG